MANFCVQLISPTRGVFFYEAAIGLPPLAFIAFLSWNLRSSVYKLRRSQSHIMTTYYSILWAVTLLNVLRFGVQVGSISHHHVALWNIMWLLTRFGMILLEVSVVVFLLHGYSSTGGEALQQALAASGFIAASDTLLKAMFIFVLHIPLFMFGGDDGLSGDMLWSKWGFWTVHTLLFAAVYSAILILPHTQWRDLLPAKPRFYRYAAVLLALNLACTLGAVLIGSGVISGYCIYGVSNWLYWASYPALLYATFLADFFSADAFDIDLEYYAEMREAGCFDEPLLPY